MSKKQLGLFVSHHLFLTKEERCKLASGEGIETIGTAVPIWVTDQGQTSEPATEVFCQYKLYNDKTLGDKEIKQIKECYCIYLPQLPSNYTKVVLSDEIWGKMTKNEQEHWFRHTKTYPTAQYLLDSPDGGAYLRFEINESCDYNDFTMLNNHFITIQDISVLKNTIV